MQAIPAQMILPDGSSISSTNTGTTTTLIPIEISERLMIQRGHTVSIVELGKKLLLAAREGNTDIVRELMGKGAPFTADWLGTSPLHFAALNNHLETCEILLRAGISRDSRTKVDRTPLHMAAYNGHVAIVQILLSSGADVEARDMLKMTPLHWAVQNGHADVVTILLKHGANSEPVNKFDKTPLDIAIETNRIDILQLLQIITKDPVTIEPFLHNDNDDDDETLTDFVQHQTKVEETTEINHEILEIQSIESQEQHSNTEMTDSIQILKDHGITFLPVDDHSSSVVASAVENGHQLVLTEVGKQVLNSTKHLMKIPVQKGPINKITNRKIITVTADQLLAMASSSKNIYKKIIPTVEKPVKRIVMNKNKFILSGTPNVNVLKRISTDNQLQADFESITRQLQEARRQAEEYKKMLKRKEEEAELYKKQLLTMANLK